MRQTLLRVLLILVTAGISARAAAAAGPVAPPNAIAWWHFDPTRFADAAGGDAQRGFVESVLRTTAASGLIKDDDAARAVEAMLAASVVGATPHTLCLLDMSLTRLADGDVAVGRLGVVLTLETDQDHRTLIRTLRTILVDAERKENGAANAGTQRKLDLPGGRSGVAYTRDGWPDWREVSWCSSPGTFTVALGKGELQTWFSAMDDIESTPVERRTPGPWEAHRQTVSQIRPPGDVFFEAWFNLDRVRHAAGEALPLGKLTDLLSAWNLSNARSVMLHGRWVDPARQPDSEVPTGAPPLLALDATWGERSEGAQIVHQMKISEDFWPSTLDMPAPPGRYAIILPSSVGDWVEGALNVYASTLGTGGQAEFERSRRHWQIRQGAALHRVIKAIGPWVVLSDYPRPVVAAPGATTVYAPLRLGVDASRFTADLERVLEPFKDRVRRDEASGVWTLDVDPGGLLSVVSWGLAESRRHPVLVGGIDLRIGGAAATGVVEKNRAWLRDAK